MKKKLIIYNVVTAFIVLALSFIFGLSVTNSNYRELSEKKIKEITAVYALNYTEGISFPADGDVRVTVIDATGTVIADSLQSSEENHLYREEVIAAAQGNPQVVVRRSDTLNKDMMYYAEKVQTADSFVYIRVAIPMESINSYALKSIVPTVFILLLVWIGSVIASVLLSGVLLKPLKQVKNGLSQIEKGSYEKITPSTDDDEVNGILSAINDLSERLQNTILTAEDEKKKLDYVLANVTDGIAVFDGELNALIANDSLKKIFGVTEPIGKRADALTADRAFISAVTDCAYNKKDVIFQTEIDGRYYLCTSRYTASDLIIVVMCDVTQEKRSEKMRLEFFANASHELKTPLTAVKGFNDMVSMQSTDEAIVGYSKRIDKEINRVINLLNDMLDLSKLENSKLDKDSLTSINMEEIAKEVCEELHPLCVEKKVSLTIEGGASVTAEREHIYGLIKNLAENGVRYNNEGGNVKIRMSVENGKSVLCVSDDGIGIDASQQSRIFERFYRVNKSRSRATGGTGLGLAIVKHVCELYDAELSLKSRLGEGTTVTVAFRCNG
ncbi:MAG: ATP-binding protein [Candidatus Coproplasma sp.]